MLNAIASKVPTTFRPVVLFAAKGANGNPQIEPASEPVTPSHKSFTVRHFMPPAKDEFHYTIPTAHGVKNDKTVVESLLGGEQIFSKIDQIIREAETGASQQKPWLMLNLYELQNPEIYPERKCAPGAPGAAIHHSLLDRIISLHREQKANVRILLDNSKQQPRIMERNPAKAFKDQAKTLMEPNHNDRTIERLRAFNVPFLTYPRDVALKNHVKLIILDNRKAIVGGMNWGNHSTMNHDGAVYIEGPDVRNIFHKVYKPDWTTSQGKSEDLPDIKPFHQGRVKVLQTTSRQADQGAKNDVLTEILKQIDKAESSIHAQLFVLTHKAVVDALIQKHRQLTQQGKEGVKLLVDEGLYKIFPNCRAGIQKLDDAGVPIRFFKENKVTEEKLHAKWAVFDRKHLLIGSANWSSLGLDSKGAEPPVQPTGDYGALSEAEEDQGGGSKIPYKTNHEIATMIENAPNVAGTFARQADHDFSFRRGVVELSKPVCWNKADETKNWKNQPPRKAWSPKRKAEEGLPQESGNSPTRKRLEISA